MLKNFEPTYRLYKHNSKIYIDYRPNSEERIRKSLGLDYNPKNLKAIEKNIDRVLLQIKESKKKEKSVSNKLNKFGLIAIEASAFNRSDRTQNDYISKFERLINPYFGNLNIEEIKAFHIDKWQSELLRKYSTTTVKRCKSVLSMIFDRAIASEMITINPVKYSTKFNAVHKKQEPYTSDEMNAILQNTTGWFQTFMYLAFTTGMRPGELLGLQWNDIDFKRGVINLQRSISKGIVTTDTYTKNHNRLVIVPEQVLKMISKLNRSFDYVFTNPKGCPFYESKSISKGYLEPFCNEFGVEYKGLKATRHTYVSIMRNGGVKQEFIQDIVGHSKLVSDKHYYKNEFTTPKTRSSKQCFFKFG